MSVFITENNEVKLKIFLQQNMAKAQQTNYTRSSKQGKEHGYTGSLPLK